MAINVWYSWPFAYIFISFLWSYSSISNFNMGRLFSAVIIIISWIQILFLHSIQSNSTTFNYNHYYSLNRTESFDNNNNAYWFFPRMLRLLPHQNDFFDIEDSAFWKMGKLIDALHWVLRQCECKQSHIENFNAHKLGIKNIQRTHIFQC